MDDIHLGINKKILKIMALFDFTMVFNTVLYTQDEVSISVCVHMYVLLLFPWGLNPGQIKFRKIGRWSMFVEESMPYWNNYSLTKRFQLLSLKLSWYPLLYCFTLMIVVLSGMIWLVEWFVKEFVFNSIAYLGCWFSGGH